MKTLTLTSEAGQRGLGKAVLDSGADLPELHYEATDKTSDKDFLCDGEDEDDDGEALKKSFNLNFIFDLFRAAMDGKIGDKNCNSTPRLSKGTRESDYVMLVLNQNQKEDEDIAILIDRLRQNGVNCIFFTRNDIRNGTSKPSAEISEVSKVKKVAIRNSKSSLIENGSISPPEILPSVPYCNGITPNQIHTLSIPTDPIPDKRSLPSTANNQSTRIQNSPFSPLPPLLSPQVELSDNHNNNTDESMITSSYSQSQDEESSVLVLTPAKEPTVRKKRRRKRRYPYTARKPVKKRNIWKDLQTDASITQTNDCDDDVRKVVSVEISPPATPDPYAFISDELEEPVIERPYTPKKSRMNGLTKDSTENVVTVKFEISNDTAIQAGSVAANSPKTINSDPRAFSPDIATEMVDSRNRSHSKASKRKIRTKSKSRSKSKSKRVQKNPKTCVQPISDDNEVKGIDELLPSDLSIHENSTPGAANVKLEAFEISDLAISSSSHDDHKSGAVTDATSSQEIPSLAVPTGVEGIESTNSAQEHQGDEIIKIESDLVTKTPLQRKQKDGDAEAPMSEASFMDAMQLRRPSFYSQIAGNVRNNLENHLDGRMTGAKISKRRKRARNGFLLHHGDNCPEDPEAPYKLHLATQIILKLNKRRSKFKPKEDKGKSLLSYLKLVPKRSSRAGKSLVNVQPPEESINNGPEESTSVFSGEWTQDRMYVCNICGHVEDYFWNMVTHKGEIHPGIVVTHVELPDAPPVGFRFPPNEPATSSLPPPPACTKCSATYSNYPDLHRHIFECAGNAAWLEEKKPPRKKPKKKRGFKRRLSNTPRKVSPKKTDTPKRRNSEVFKCEFCTREFKTEGWLKNHLVTHSLPISIPLSKLTLPPRAFNSSRRSCVQNLIAKA